jgi:hypothetical protein
LNRHSEAIDVAFYQAERYILSIVNWNHIPDPEDQREFEAFHVYCKEKFDAHNDAVWTRYKESMDGFFILPYYGRKEKWETNNQKMYERFVIMLKTFKKISNGTYKVGNE